MEKDDKNYIEGAPDENGSNAWLIDELLPPEEDRAVRLKRGAEMYKEDPDEAVFIYGDVLIPWLKEQGIEVDESKYNG